MEIRSVKVGILRTNAYVVVSKGEAVIIDAGGDASRILELTEGFKVRAVIATHGHFDHVLAVPEIKKITGAAFLMHKDDIDVLDFSWSVYGMGQKPEPDRFIDEGDIIRFGKTELWVLHTPGHTPGSICLFNLDAKTIFTGDTLFYGAIGRTDFYGGDHTKILESIKKILSMFPDDMVVYPGHGKTTTIGTEKKNLSVLLT